jgi:hypothetical protein
MQTASGIDNTTFLTKFNNAELSNEQLLITLDTDWSAIQVKLRSERLVLHTTRARLNGKTGTNTPKDPISKEAEIWLATGVIQENPKQGKYVPLEIRIANGTVRIVNNVVENITVVTPAALVDFVSSTTTDPISSVTIAVPDPILSVDVSSIISEDVKNSFSINLKIKDIVEPFEGETLEVVIGKIRFRLAELGMQKLHFTDALGYMVTENNFKNGLTYTVKQQLYGADKVLTNSK